MFNKILIANRGEIAVRVIKACQEMDITAVAVYSDADRSSLHVQTADEAVYLGAAPAGESYLNIEKIIQAGKAKYCEFLVFFKLLFYLFEFTFHLY